MSKTVAILFCLLLVLPRAGNAAAEERIVAKIGAREITATEFNDFLRYSLAPGQSPESIDNKQKAMLLQQIVTAMVIADIARQEKYDQRPEVKERLKLGENNFLTLHYLNDVVAAKISADDAAVQRYYKEYADDFKKNDGSLLPMAEVRDLIENKLTRDQRRESVDAFVQQAMQKAGAEVDVKALIGSDPHFSQ